MVWPVWVVQLVVSVVASVIIGYLNRPDIPNAKPGSGRAPEAKDGTVIRKVYGTVWIDDSQVLAYKEGTPIPIRKKGGKK